MNQHQRQVIEYVREENRVLREQLGDRRLRFNDDQRRRWAAQAKGLGRKLLTEVATVVTPETLWAWHRKLIALIPICNQLTSGRSSKIDLRHGPSQAAQHSLVQVRVSLESDSHVWCNAGVGSTQHCRGVIPIRI
jgi:hypothetical protein